MTYGALIFKGMPGRLQLDPHRPLPDHASIRARTFTREGRISRVALQIEVADVHTVRHRDVNAARNVLKRAVRVRGAALREDTTAWLQAVAPETSSAKVAA